MIFGGPEGFAREMVIQIVEWLKSDDDDDLRWNERVDWLALLSGYKSHRFSWLTISPDLS
jgi:hypothetical protein